MCLAKMKRSLVIVVVLSLAWTLSVFAAPSSNELNPCEPTNSPIYCSCNDEEKEKATQAKCFITSSNVTPENPVWSAFKVQPKLQKLQLTSFRNQTLKQFPSKVFQVLQNSLAIVELSDLNITSLPAGVFKSMPNLEQVDITLCPLMTIERKAFSNLPKLQKAIFNKNKFPVLTNMFEEVPSIVELYLEDNNIETIEYDAFSGLTYLKYLMLDRNMIAKIEPKMFTGLRSVLELNLPRNYLSHIPANAFIQVPQVGTLDLSYNKIELLDELAFAGLEQLKVIKLEHNRLNTIPPGPIFTRVPFLEIIHLDFNNLQHLSRSTFFHSDPAFKRYIRIHVKGNRLVCTCALFWIRDALQSYDSVQINELQTTDCWAEVPSEDNSSEMLLSKTNYTIFDFLHRQNSVRQCAFPEIQRANEGPARDITVPVETLDHLDESEHNDQQEEGQFMRKEQTEVENKFKSRLIAEHEKHRSTTPATVTDTDSHQDNQFNQAGFGAVPKDGSSAAVAHLATFSQTMAVVLLGIVLARF